MEGEKIKINRILNVEITVLHFKIEDSKFKDKGKGKCLYLQIEFKGEKNVVFTGSENLMEMINQVRPEDFPFTTTIRSNDQRLEFT